MSDSLQPHESQHTRPPWPSPSPGVHSNSCPSSRWCHPAISSSVVPFSSCPQSLPASESFPMSQLCVWGGQSTGVSALASFLPKNNQGWSPSQWTGWISLQSKGLSRVFSNTTVQKHQFFSAQLSSQSNSHIHTWSQEKLQQYVNRELPDVQAGFRKGRGTRDQIANTCWIMEKSKRIPEKHLFLPHWLHESLWLYGSQQTVENP